MAERLPDTITTPTTEAMFSAMGSAYLKCMGGPPTKEKVCLLLAQSAFETGWWKYMHCFNIGNVKSVEGDGRDYTYFRCWELVPQTSVKALQAHPKYGHLVTQESVDQYGRAKIWLAPDHPGCRFRAYRSLDLGIFDHFGKLLDRYTDEDPLKDAWAYVVKAEPIGFVRALKAKGYFTGDLQIYTKQVTDIFNLLCKKPFDVSQFRPHTDKEEDMIRNWRIAATMRGIGEIHEREGSEGTPDSA